MNFASHAAVAAMRSNDPDLLLGAMLPDVSSVLGVKLRRPNPALDAGISLHYATDSAFHSSRWFVQRMKECSALLQAAGIERGPARAVGHVGVELLLDGALLASDHSFATMFQNAWRRLADADDVVRTAVAPDDEVVWIERIEMFTSTLEPSRYGEPQYSAQRIVRMLRDRPRLRVPTEQTGIVTETLTTMLATIDGEANDVVRDIATAVEAASGR